MNPLLMTVLLVVALTIFTRTMIGKIKLLAALEPARRLDHLLDHLKERLVSLLVIAIGQKRLIGRAKERSSGIMHALIFWGFCVLLIRSITLYGEGFHQGFQLPFFGEEHLTGYLYLFVKDIMEGIVLIMVLWAIFRRAVIRPKRMKNSFEAYFVLVMIAVLMISDLTYDGIRYNLIYLHGHTDIHFFHNPKYGSEFLWTPVTMIAAWLVSGIGVELSLILLSLMFWTHICTQLTFLNVLPIGKHFHVITALPNVFLKSLGYPHEKTKLLDLEDESAWENESLGINHIHQLNWKQGLDLYTCTECGRCKDVCPTYLTEKPLNLFDFNDSLKHELYANAPRVIKRAGLVDRLAKKSPDQVEDIEFLKGEIAMLHSPNQLVGDVIAEDTLWACTTCRACEAVCPVTIEHVPRIIAMRQGQTLMAETYPKELNVALKGLERNGNPWGIGYDKRADWAEGLNIPSLAEKPDAEYLFWVGCAGSFDDRTKKVSVSLAKILQKAGVDFAILGVEEKCTGDFARRVGNEMLFQMMAQENIETLNGYGVKKIITACPHCLNSLKYDYPDLGGNFEVIHHTVFIKELVKAGKIKLDPSFSGALTYHDPCYLGRYNDVYHEPREILKSIAGDHYQELDRHGSESFCCGAGGGRMWMEENIGKRINEERAGQIIAKDVSHVAVACPFCLTMVEDGMKALEKEESVKTLDLAELVEQNMV